MEEGCIDLTNIPPKQLEVALAEQHQITQCREVAKRRPAFKAVEGGVDVELTMALLRQKKLSREEAGSLRLVMCGGAHPRAIATTWGKSANCACGAPVCTTASCRKKHERRR